MKTRTWPAVLIAGALLTAPTASQAESKDASKTRQIKVEGLTLTVPTAWKQKTLSKRSMRKAEIEVPAAKGDKESGEIAIFYFKGGGGPIGQNITRWIGQFQSRGRKTKLVNGTASQGTYFLAEISGTYNQPVGPPILRKTKPLPNAKMLGVILQEKTTKKTFYIRFTGPAATVDANAKLYRAFFAGDAKSEKEVKLPGREE